MIEGREFWKLIDAFRARGCSVKHGKWRTAGKLGVGVRQKHLWRCDCGFRLELLAKDFGSGSEAQRVLEDPHPCSVQAFWDIHES